MADDNEINRKVIRIILRKLGYSCVEAENGEEALELYRKGDYDYIFMDIDMPYMDGIETTLPLFRSLVRHRDIIDGNYDIHWLENYLAGT